MPQYRLTRIFITVNPYLGTDSIEPYFAQMKARNRGLFVLVKTSNPGSGEIQDLIMQQTGAPLYETVGQLVAQWGEPFYWSVRLFRYRRGSGRYAPGAGETAPQAAASCIFLGAGIWSPRRKRAGFGRLL